LCHKRKHEFLGTFAKFRSATTRFVTSLPPSVSLRPQGTIHLPPAGFSGNLIFEHLLTISQKIRVSLKSDKFK